MKVRDNLTGILVAGCVAAIVGFALWLNFAPCLSVNWVQMHGFGRADGWTDYEAWCVDYNEGRRPLYNWLKVRKDGEKPVILRAAASVGLYPQWTTRKYVYGWAVNRTKSSKEKDRRGFAFRVNSSGKLEVCTEIENINSLGSVDDQGKDGQTDWVRLKTWSIENLPRPDGWLTIRFDRCVDGSDLVSFSGRLKSRLHKYGLCADPVQHFIGAVPNLTVNDIVFDDKIDLWAPAKAPSKRSGNAEGPEYDE